ncbi:796_t:CDS:2 [Dentiscutata erythropus]|uniref:796_t:CDS:1 n=1 Tax=Dentiscutata erythropus TaxID=1348616 RepID=A0A9N8WQZ4_9GLOM|nr:796_t:CDS:2 [Dentiscutata erythropus]
MAKNSRNKDDSISLKYTTFGLKSSKEDIYTEDEMNAPLLSDNSRNEGILVIDESSDNAYLEDVEIARMPHHGGSVFSSFLNMANSIIGAGLPYSFREAGIWSGIILLIGLTMVVDWTIRLLVLNAKLSGRSSYQDIMQFCFGKSGMVAISLFQFAFAFGALYRDISKLAKASGLALISMVIIVVSVVIEGPQVDQSLRGSENGKWAFIHDEVFQSIGVISFAFVCHHNSLLIFDALHKPTIDRFATVTHLSTFVSLVSCMLMALCGYLIFTNKTEGDNVIINIARFCFGFNMFTTLPLELFVCREVINNYYFPNEQFNVLRHVIITTLLVGGAMIISLLTDNLGTVLELTGGFSATALAYILPPACYLKLSSGKLWTLNKLPAILCVIFGILVMVLSTMLSIANIIDGWITPDN